MNTFAIFGPPPPAALIPPHRVATLVQTQIPQWKDTLEVAPKATAPYIPSRPQLDKIPPFSPYRMMRLSEKLHDLGVQRNNETAYHLDKETAESAKLSQEKIEKLQENIEKNQQSSTWSALHKISSQVLSAISIVLGIAIVTTTPALFIGTVLITSGILSLSNLILSEGGFWDFIAEKIAADDKVKREKLRHLIPCVIGFLASGLQFLSLGALSIWGTLNMTSKALLIAQTLSNLSTTMTGIGSEVARAKVAWSEAELKKIQGKLSLNTQTADSHSRELEITIEAQQRQRRLAKNLIDLTIDTRRKALSPEY